MPKLIFIQPKFSQDFIDLPDGVFSVGRSRHNLIIIEDASVSKEHAELLVHGTEFIVRERGSQNGTFVGGVRIQAQSGVKHGQKIRFGRVELLLELDLPEFEGTTNITAVASLMRPPDKAGTPSRTPTVLPCRFKARETAPPVMETVQAPITQPAPSTCLEDSRSSPTSNSRIFPRPLLWLILISASLLLAARWLLK